MIFLGNLTVIDPTKSKVGMVHDMPFDTVNGMKMTQAQLESIGVLVDSVPDPLPLEGQQVTGMFIDPATKIISYEYAVPPKTEVELNTERIDAMENALMDVMSMM